MHQQHIIEQIKTCLIAESDFSIASNMAQDILEKNLYETGELKNGFESLAYTTSLVTTYARPFSSNRKLYKIPEIILKSLTSDQNKLHAKIIDLRNKTFAHTDGDIFEASFEPFNDGSFANLITPREFLFGLQKNDIIILQDIISKLRYELNSHKKNLKAKLT